MIPKPYEYLNKLTAPKMILAARSLYGIRETSGPKNTPEIMRWADELGPGVRQIYSGDSIPWCGLFMAYVAMISGKPVPRSPLWALSWATWGNKSYEPCLGDVLVFSRDGGGHVGLYVAEESYYYHVLGGNQNDGVTIAKIAKSRFRAARNYYAIGKPQECIPVYVRGGVISYNER